MKNFNIKSTAALSVLGIMMGCAHQIKPFPISSSANPTEEINNQHAMMTEAYRGQVDVLAAKNFQEAKDSFSKAKEENQDGKEPKEVLKHLGYSKAYLQLANQEAASSYPRVEEISKSREQSLNAGARNFPDKLEELDKDLKVMALAAPGKYSLDEKAKLQGKYLALELVAIKHNKLGKIQKTLANAKDKKAEKIVPTAYSQAVQKYTIAEKIIETDRHNNPTIESAVVAAAMAADRVTNLMASEKTSRAQTPEQRAVTLESRDKAINTANSNTFAAKVDTFQKNQELKETEQVLADQNAVLAVSQNENLEHKIKEYDDKVVADAAAQFDKSEADVYRQNGVLIIRLKSMNFASGRSDLPSDSMAILSKVKTILKNINAGDVMVEGHTDGVGAAKINQQLSEKRAESVVKYFSTDPTFQNNKMESTGYGYSKPLATNKTSAGRAQNRRVDILVKTNQSL